MDFATKANMFIYLTEQKKKNIYCATESLYL